MAFLLGFMNVKESLQQYIIFSYGQIILFYIFQIPLFGVQIDFVYSCNIMEVLEISKNR